MTDPVMITLSAGAGTFILNIAISGVFGFLAGLLSYGVLVVAPDRANGPPFAVHVGIALAAGAAAYPFVSGAIIITEAAT